MDETKRVHWSEVSGPVFLQRGFYYTLDDAAETYLDDSDLDDLDLGPECYLTIPLRPQVDVDELADSLLSQAHCRGWDGLSVAVEDLVEWDDLEAFVQAWNAKQQVCAYSEDLSRRVDWSGYPWEKRCGNHESWAPKRKKIAELRAREVHDE